MTSGQTGAILAAIGVAVVAIYIVIDRQVKKISQMTVDLQCKPNLQTMQMDCTVKGSPENLNL